MINNQQHPSMADGLIGHVPIPIIERLRRQFGRLPRRDDESATYHPLVVITEQANMRADGYAAHRLRTSLDCLGKAGLDGSIVIWDTGLDSSERVCAMDAKALIIGSACEVTPLRELLRDTVAYALQEIGRRHLVLLTADLACVDQVPTNTNRNLNVTAELPQAYDPENTLIMASHIDPHGWRSVGLRLDEFGVAERVIERIPAHATFHSLGETSRELRRALPEGAYLRYGPPADSQLR